MRRRRIAVTGGGVSGITAGYVLAQADDVTLIEAGGRLGGHADTHLVVPPAGPPIGVDTGFIVYNERTYPLLTRLFAELGVATQPAPMSMSVRRAARGLADQRDPGGQTLADFLRTSGFCAYFTAHFALPLVAAVWSCPVGTALRYPAGYLFAFLAQHGMLSVSGSPPWRTVTGGSRAGPDGRRRDPRPEAGPVTAIVLLTTAAALLVLQGVTFAVALKAGERNQGQVLRLPPRYAGYVARASGFIPLPRKRRA